MIDKKTMSQMLEMGIEADKVLKLYLDSDDEPAPKPEEKKDPAKKPDPNEPGGKTEPDPNKPGSKQEQGDPVLEAINRLTGMVQAGALRQGPERGEETTEQILARVLTRADKKKEG